LTNTFQQFIDTFQLPKIEIGEDTSLINQEAIYLGFEDEGTGIVVRENRQEMIQTGGGVVYAQNANGKIICYVVLPYIEYQGPTG